MDVIRISGHTRVLGVDQAYRPLHIRDEIIDCGPLLGKQPVMVSEWRPSPEELDAIIAGAPVRLKVLGRVHPPVLVEVGEVVRRERLPYPIQPRLSPDGDRLICDICLREWAIGQPSGCEPCTNAALGIVHLGKESANKHD